MNQLDQMRKAWLESGVFDSLARLTSLEERERRELKMLKMLKESDSDNIKVAAETGYMQELGYSTRIVLGATGGKNTILTVTKNVDANHITFIAISLTPDRAIKLRDALNEFLGC